MSTKKTNVEKVYNMFSTGKKCTSSGIAKRLYGEVTYNSLGRVRAIISKLNSDGDLDIRLVSEGTYQAK